MQWVERIGKVRWLSSHTVPYLCPYFVDLVSPAADTRDSSRQNVTEIWKKFDSYRQLSFSISIYMHAIIHIVHSYILTINREEEANDEERERTARPTMKGSHKEEVENSWHMERCRVLKFGIIWVFFRLTSNTFRDVRWRVKLRHPLSSADIRDCIDSLLCARSTMKSTREIIDKIANKRKSI